MRELAKWGGLVTDTTMFAGLPTEGDDSPASSSEEVEEEAPKAAVKQAPPPPRAKPASLLPEADDFDEEDDDASLPSNSAPSNSVYGDIDREDLEITIDTLKLISRDLTLFRSKPFKALREAIGPLATALTGGDGGVGANRRGGRRGGGAAGTGGKSGTKLDGLTPTERLKVRCLPLCLCMCPSV